MSCIYFRPEVGGLESHVYHLCRGLVERGHRVDFVTSLSKEGSPSHEVMDGISVWRTWMPSRGPVGWALHALGSVPRLRERAATADLIHAQAFASVFPAAMARRVRGAPLVATYHTSHFLRRARRAHWRPVLARMVRTADYNLAASREIADVAEALAPGVRVEALTNGVDTRVFQPGEPAVAKGARPRLVVPRRLFEKNGVEFLVRAMPRIVQLVDAEALVIGDGPERGRLESLAASLGVSERITFLGARPNEEMPGLLRSGDVSVLPSLMEATSVAALESMACGVPVAASRVGGLPEIVDETVGDLFEPGNPGDLAETVAGLLESPDLAARGARARERVVAQWSNDRLVERHLEIYGDVLGRRPRTAA